MPKYAWEDPKTGEQWETDMKYEEMLEYKADNPDLHQIFAINFTSDRYDSGIKNDGGWNELLDRVADKNPESDLEGRRKRSAKEIKTREAIEKNRKKLGIKSDVRNTTTGDSHDRLDS